jgi:hypothetical protein
MNFQTVTRFGTEEPSVPMFEAIDGQIVGAGLRLVEGPVRDQKGRWFDSSRPDHSQPVQPSRAEYPANAISA